MRSCQSHFWRHKFSWWGSISCIKRTLIVQVSHSWTYSIKVPIFWISPAWRLYVPTYNIKKHISFFLVYFLGLSFMLSLLHNRSRWSTNREEKHEEGKLAFRSSFFFGFGIMVDLVCSSGKTMWAPGYEPRRGGRVTCGMHTEIKVARASQSAGCEGRFKAGLICGSMDGRQF